ncbi:MAG: lamin tail domain-containing protein, partial [Patescibacteria group bacterium]|nr:lamin tail domain-containing protein [Patescibacteria group bacterium]
FAQLWEKWGECIEPGGVKAECKQKAREEIKIALVSAIKTHKFVKEEPKPSLLEKAKLAWENLVKQIEKIERFVKKANQEVENAVESALSQIKSVLFQLNPFKAAVAPAPEKVEAPKEKAIEEKAPEIEKEPPLVEEKIEEIGKVEAPQTPGIGRERPLSLEEVQERLDDISERVDILSAKVAKLVETATSSISEETSKTEGKEETEPEESEKTVKEKESEEVGQEVGQKFCERITGSYPIRNKIIINEVAWMGTGESSNNEWIELKNISGTEINLAGWQLLDKDQQIKIIFNSQNRVLANGFFLLERSDDETVPGVAADLIYTGSLKNTDEALYLFDENCQLQDEVIASPNWLAGDNNSKRTAERRNDLSWQTSANPGGTPKAENSGGYVEYYGGGGGVSSPPPEEPPTPSYLKILISEIQIESQTSEKDDFVELYNPNSEDVDLTNWYLQRKTKTGSDFSSYAPKNLFSGKIIKKHDYFLIANASSTFSADATTTHPLTSDNTLYLKNPNGEVVDKVSWGEAQDYETATTSNPKAGESIGRKWSTTSESYIDTDNNREDFEIQEPTPKAKNKPKVEPENQLPIASFTFSPQNPFIGDEIFFDASSSIDRDGTITGYIWDFGDGNSTTTTQATTAHSYSTSGFEYLVRLVVQDNQGATSTTTSTIEVKAHQLAQNVIISEVQIKKNEFVELYNPTDQSVSTAGWYLSYFPAKHDWNNPWRINIQFPTTTIASSTYFLIGLKDYSVEEGYPEPDWQPSVSTNLNNKTGAIGIFSCNPSASTTEAAIGCKIDLFSWREENSTSTLVFEGSSFLFKESDLVEKSLQRKKNKEGFYIDDDNNSTDFELKIPLPENSKGEKADIFRPEKVSDFKIDEENSENNKVVLTWSTTTDPDTPPENLSYQIYYSKEEITEDNLNSSSTFSATTSATTLTISNLDYNSTYHFGIEAFDGWHYSLLSDIISYQTATISTIESGFTLDPSLPPGTEGRKMVRASNGNLYVVYAKQIEGIYNVFLAKSIDEGKSWTKEVITSESSYNQIYPSIAIDSNDNLHLVWMGKISANGPYQIRYRRYNGTWSEIKNLTDNENWDQESPIIALDSADNIHLVWVDKKLCSSSHELGSFPCPKPRYRKYNNNLSYFEEIDLPVGGGRGIGHFSMAIDSEDNIHLVWCSDVGRESLSLKIKYWRQTSTSSEELGNGSRASIAIDKDGHLHVVWEEQCGCHISYKKYTNSWSERYQILESDIDTTIAFPSIALDANGHIYVVCSRFSKSDDKWHIYLRKYTDAWQSIESLEAINDQNFPNSLWSFYPIISGIKTNQPKKGYLFIYYEGEDLKFFASHDLTWE